MDCAFVYKARMSYNDDEDEDEDEARTSCASVRLGRVVSETNAFHFKCSCFLVTPWGPCFLSFSVAAAAAAKTTRVTTAITNTKTHRCLKDNRCFESAAELVSLSVV